MVQRWKSSGAAKTVRRQWGGNRQTMWETVRDRVNNQDKPMVVFLCGGDNIRPSVDALRQCNMLMVLRKITKFFLSFNDNKLH